MVEHAADTLNRHARLFQCRVIDDVAAGLLCLLSMLLAQNGEEAHTHAKQQAAPIHHLTVKHTVVAVLAGLDQGMEVLAVHTEDTLAVEAEQAQRDNQLQGRHTLLLLQTEPTEGLRQTKTTEGR